MIHRSFVVFHFHKDVDIVVFQARLPFKTTLWIFYHT